MEPLENSVVFCYYKQMKRLLSIIIILAAVYGIGQFFLFDKTDRALTVTIPAGASASGIADILAESGISKTAFWPKVLMYVSGIHKKMQAGVFYIPRGTTLFGVLSDLTKLQYQEREITLLEGWNLRDISKYLIDQKISAVKAVYQETGEPATIKGVVGRDWSKEFPVLLSKPKYVSLEGFVFPDTYRVETTATAEDIIRKVLRNFDKKLTPELRLEIAKQRKTVFEIITMASIVEREVRAYENKQMVADIFWRRLGRNMGLEADSTVNYATGKSLPSVTYDDLKITSLWNTYKYRGLPPGPISNPGIDSIRAAIYPKSNPYWYFLTTKEGKVIYSKTYTGHINNKNKYLK